MGFLAGVLSTLGLVAGGVIGGAVLARRRFARYPAAFACRVRRPRGRRRRWPVPRREGCRLCWGLGRTAARWVHDVLVVQSGPLGLSVTPLAARIGAEAALRRVPSREARGLGSRPWAVVLTTEDGGSLEIAVAEWDRERLVGPYLTVALTGLPSAPREHGV